MEVRRNNFREDELSLEDLSTGSGVMERREGEVGREEGEVGREEGETGREEGETGREEGEAGREEGDEVSSLPTECDMENVSSCIHLLIFLGMSRTETVIYAIHV
eukprot:Lithocolla_globosa_v1_NODE_941_length_3056_cov_4.187604.p2 type:complete len:105 gc:universal NODE_941_length_3056_cov_4.187604:1201-887(-)